MEVTPSYTVMFKPREGVYEIIDTTSGRVVLLGLVDPGRTRRPHVAPQVEQLPLDLEDEDSNA